MENKVISFPSLVRGLCRVRVSPEEGGKREEGKRKKEQEKKRKELGVSMCFVVVVTVPSKASDE